MEKLIIKAETGKLFIGIFIDGILKITDSGDYLFLSRTKEPIKEMIGMISLN